MNDKNITSFWKGFIPAAVVAAVLFWLRRQERQIAPGPVVLGRREAAQPDAAATERDALEAIEGIGPVYASRLHQAGIRTFDDVARASADDLRAITGTTRWDPADWIAQARELGRKA